jgi:hypothetical protein
LFVFRKQGRKLEEGGRENTEIVKRLKVRERKEMEKNE